MSSPRIRDETVLVVDGSYLKHPGRGLGLGLVKGGLGIGVFRGIWFCGVGGFGGTLVCRSTIGDLEWNGCFKLDENTSL